MAFVNALRFNDYSGAIISDEESWHLRKRKTVFGDNIHCLVTPEISNALHIEAVYGGVGTPSIHFETVTKTQQRLQNIFQNRTKPAMKSQGYHTVADINRIALENLQAAIRRRVDDRLQLLYGFSSEDINRGYLKSQGERIDIKQGAVKNRALAISTLKDKGEPARAERENHACLIGYDKKNGFTAYCLKGDISVSSFVSGGFESLGTGKYAGGQAFAEFLNKKLLHERTKGFDRVEGMIELIYSAIQCSIYYHGVGGYLGIIYINGRGKDHRTRYKEIFHHPAKLATEIVRAYKAGYLPRNKAYQLIDDLIYEDEDTEKVETRMFKAAKNRKVLEFFLRNYKLDTRRKG